MTGTNWLARKDSNLDFQGQNLTCYHYTTGEQRGEVYRKSVEKIK